MPATMKVLFPDKLEKGHSVRRFFSRYEACVTLLDLKDDKQKAAQLILLLGDDGFDFVSGLEDTIKTDYGELKDKIIEKWEGKLPEEYVAQFQSLTLKVGGGC